MVRIVSLYEILQNAGIPIFCLVRMDIHIQRRRFPKMSLQNSKHILINRTSCQLLGNCYLPKTHDHG